MINWHVSKQDAATINEIAQRAVQYAREQDIDIKPIEFQMDITACHLNSVPLQLSELAAAPKFDFVHDVFGIRRHLNRSNGQLEDCFLPRYARNDTRYPNGTPVSLAGAKL